MTCIMKSALLYPPPFPPAPQRPTIALVMGPKGLITSVASSHPNVMTPRPTIALVMGPKAPDHSAGHGTQGAHQPPPRLHTCIVCPTLPPVFPLSSPQRPTIALVMGPKGLISRNAGRAARSGTTDDGGVENATAPSNPSVPPLPVGGGGDGKGIPSTSSVPTLHVGGGGDVEGIPSTPSVPPLPAGSGHHASGCMPLPTAPPSTMNGMPVDR
ncbi:unnamed protein product [Closterium sp. Naga37s-1]|nr:unnamed protein product [Closterium sp. Naga37s-1]